VPAAAPLPDLLAQRDPALIRKIFPALSWIVDHYFRAEVEGLENFPEGRSLGVMTHNGGVFMPDLHCLMVAFWRRFGLETPGYGLMHKMAFSVPGLGRFLTACGAIPASRENGDAVLEHDYPLLVCPGGDVDSLKPFRDRHRVMFAGRAGFIRMAIRHQAPIVPVVSVGAHEVFVVLNDGRWIAETFGFARMFRIKSVPLALSFPFGLTPAGLGAIPLPSKIRVRVLPPIDLDLPPEAEHDGLAVAYAKERVRVAMQRGLDELSARRRFLFG
jgi:1-acyl-sn-glycerol-3-phosphate acyltransferase